MEKNKYNNKNQKVLLSKNKIENLKNQRRKLTDKNSALKNQIENLKINNKVSKFFIPEFRLRTGARRKLSDEEFVDKSRGLIFDIEKHLLENEFKKNENEQ